MDARLERRRRWLRTLTCRVLPAAILVFLTTASGCPQPTGITIQASDSSAPSLTLGVQATVAGGPGATVEVGGVDQTISLTAKTGALNLLASATDPETGVRSVEIWVERTVTRCPGVSLCSGGNPPLLGGPEFSSTEPVRPSGATDSPSSLLADAIDLTAQIPQSAPAPGTSRTIRWRFWSEAENHLQGRSVTPVVEVVFHESA
jgi:hypothetical protein